ncbi:methionyl-tRNA formyltransferase [Roseofilum casamattae]|uniref:Methionyl-tRNA formyltransferase n=1 Tax=Roseofilum casamattae BLCC-M143 TaxID=3022442 RepID=A0ABT7BWE7_9CYAN|nr:methionyl-tRNA formyltransferase [Roseofilum casamattae]MDJ1182839.1 methionyl-tRNA formyltransferase [Roseofilum casamattae BLCC-M143]
MNVIFMGTPQFALPTLQQLLDRPEFNVLGVVTQPDKRRGRGGKQTPSAVKALALDRELPVWQPQRIKKDAEVLATLEAMEADVFVVVAYGQILSARILQMPKLGCINVHGSILPQYRGAAPIQWALYHGERETGITTMLMNEGMDTGDMLLTATTPISLSDNSATLSQRLAQMGAELLVETLLKLPDMTPIPQDDTLATYAPLIRKEDYGLDWNKPALQLHHQVQGFFPSCLTSFRDRPLKVIETVPFATEKDSELPDEYRALMQQLQDLPPDAAKPGEIVILAKKLGPIVQTGQGFLLLRQVQAAGKRPQSGVDLANGARIQIGELLI